MRRSHAVLCALFLAACAEPPKTRVAVQADAIAKSDLEGVFYFRQTVVGVPYTTGFTFIGEQGLGCRGKKPEKWDENCETPKEAECGWHGVSPPREDTPMSACVGCNMRSERGSGKRPPPTSEAPERAT